MRSEPHKLKRFEIRFAIDEEQIGFEMTLAVIVPITDERMVMPSKRKDFVGGQEPDRRVQKLIKSRAVLACPYPPEGFF
jgi:hypothetical protein